MEGVPHLSYETAHTCATKSIDTKEYYNLLPLSYIDFLKNLFFYKKQLN